MRILDYAHGLQAGRGLLLILREAGPIHDPERNPFYEGLWADIQDGIETADRGDLVDGEHVFCELLGEEPAVAEN